MRGHVLHAITDLNTKESTPFVPVHDARAYLAENNPTRLADILDEIFHRQEPPIDSTTVLNDYVAILCILLETGKGPFFRDFVTHDLKDKKLPFDPHQEPPLGFPRVLTASGDFYALFCKNQWKFCVPNFEKNLSRVFHVDQILPIERIQKIADGRSGSVFHEIRLHSSYNFLKGHTLVV